MSAPRKNLKRIGVLGGTFDPPHFGHLEISKIILKKLKLKQLIWAVTKRNPLKKKSHFSTQKRVSFSKTIASKVDKIKVKSFDDIIKSSKTIELIKYVKKRYKRSEIYFLMGADSLIDFHKWHQWKKISQKCNIIVFDRHGYKKKSLNSTTYKRLNTKNLKFIEFNKVNISSSQLRKI